MSSCALRILILDDEVAVRHVFTAVLSKDGYLITEVATARHALVLLRDVEFDLIIVDISLPAIDGVEVIREIRSEHPELKIIASSGFMSRPLRKTVVAAGAADVLAKPITPSDLQRAVYSALDSSLSRQRGPEAGAETMQK